uniref:Uncharacterized protein n=1 Tax=viral metagenome TaxID=1070528 RepID=A0A6M3LE42_9ZZZZ
MTRDTLAWVGLAALVVGLLAFDSTLFTSGDNARYIALARSVWAGDGLVHTWGTKLSVERSAAILLPVVLAPVSSSIVLCKGVVLLFWIGGMVAFAKLLEEVEG